MAEKKQYTLEVVRQAFRQMEKDTLDYITTNIRRIHQLQALQDVVTSKSFTERANSDLTIEEIYTIVQQYDEVCGSELVDNYIEELRGDQLG